jgi:hypothetical protein
MTMEGSLKSRAFHGASGATLIETMFAVVILAIATLFIMSLLTLSVGQNWAAGDRGTRASEYAQDKMEQLLALSFSDSSSNTTVYPTAASGGTGLAVGGGTNTSSPVTGYVDYLDDFGNLQTSSSTNSAFIRVWSVSDNTAGNLKTITVVAQAINRTANEGPAASTTLVCMKSN